MNASKFTISESASNPIAPVTPGFNRRRFISACATCMACSAAPFFAPLSVRATAKAKQRPKVRLVFCETPNDQPIWPNLGYNFEERRLAISHLLEIHCPEVEFLPVRLLNDSKQSAQVLATDAEVDGYVVCVQGLGWNNDLVKLCSSGKPTLLVDNLFGGSGLFLRDIAGIMSSGKAVDWVSSSKDDDLIASVRHMAGSVQARTSAETVAAFRAERRKNTPLARNWSCKADSIAKVDFEKGLQQLHRTRLLVVGGGWGGDEFRKASKEVTGVEFVPLSFEELAAAYDQAKPDQAARISAEWMVQAEKIEGVPAEEFRKSGAMYVAMRQLLDKYQARGISVNCLGGFYGGHLKAYPCLGFCQLNNDGLVGGCEGDQMSALTMAVMGVLTERPGYISDPVIDTSRSAIVYAHCVATTKPFGPTGRSNAYHVLTHSEDRKGASMRSLLPLGYLVTTLEINPTARQVLIHQGKTIGNNPSDMACRTKLEAVVKGDIEKLTEHWRMGWHRVTFYGDLRPQVEELCQRLHLQLVEEA